MAYEQRDNSGSLFKNEKKTEPKHPDYKGDAMIDGQEMWISAWIKDGKNGKFMSLAFNRKEEGGNKPASKPSPSASTAGAPF